MRPLVETGRKDEGRVGDGGSSGASGFKMIGIKLRVSRSSSPRSFRVGAPFLSLFFSLSSSSFIFFPQPPLAFLLGPPAKGEHRLTAVLYVSPFRRVFFGDGQFDARMSRGGQSPPNSLSLSLSLLLLSLGCGRLLRWKVETLGKVPAFHCFKFHLEKGE
jgi:hypothetical protein